MDKKNISLLDVKQQVFIKRNYIKVLMLDNSSTDACYSVAAISK